MHSPKLQAPDSPVFQSLSSLLNKTATAIALLTVLTAPRSQREVKVNTEKQTRLHPSVVPTAAQHPANTLTVTTVVAMVLLLPHVVVVVAVTATVLSQMERSSPFQSTMVHLLVVVTLLALTVRRAEVDEAVRATKSLTTATQWKVSGRTIRLLDRRITRTCHRLLVWMLAVEAGEVGEVEDEEVLEVDAAGVVLVRMLLAEGC